MITFEEIKILKRYADHLAQRAMNLENLLYTDESYNILIQSKGIRARKLVYARRNCHNKCRQLRDLSATIGSDYEKLCKLQYK